MKKRMGWYGVKTLYRSAPVGRRQGIDRLYSDQVTLVEERVVLVRARSLDAAIRKAEREARRYAADWHRNPYGQRVRTRYLGFVEAFDIDDEVGDGCEIFSETEVVWRAITDRSVIERQVGRPESRRTFEARRNVLDICFLSPAPGVRLTARERAQRARLDALKKR